VQNTCVGVVIWLLGIRVPLLLMTNVSRIFFVIMPKKTTNSRNLKLIKPLVNLILFEERIIPNFEKAESKPLSKNYLKYYYNKDLTFNTMRTNYFSEKLDLYLQKLSKKDGECLLLNPNYALEKIY
jgi:hypothetical protein